MKEVTLQELEEWYRSQLDRRFKKEHKLLTKLFKMAEKEIAETRNSLKGWIKEEGKIESEEEKLDEKSQKILERFVEKISESLSTIKIPTIHTDITYENSQNFCEDIKKLYIVYNQTGRKSIPRFGKQYNLELKEIDLNLRKIGNISSKVAKFLRKNYKDGKDAESIVKKIPQLEHNIERLVQIKGKIGEMETEFTQLKDDLKIMEENLLKLSGDADLQKFEEIEIIEQQKKIKLRDSLKFNKAFKKMKKAIEKGEYYSRGISEAELRPYLKRPVESILEEGPKLNNLKEILIKTRLILEDNTDPLNMKADLKKRIIDNINSIVTNNKLENPIQELLDIEKKKQEIGEILDKKGIGTQRKDIKEKIATVTIDSEHFEIDLEKRKREYRELLDKISFDRNDLQKEVKNQTGDEIKLKVIIPS